MKGTGWTAQGLKYKDLITLMTYPSISVNLVSIYVSVERNVVKCAGLTPMWAGKFSSPLVQNV